ncbi:hypothetical protein BJ878DRAFT_480144 [Calycina marina]|uniref:Uncharacterized protein n=1 Tax=Calycina marina TaxID=1763456 RepID=A0A9P7Z3Y4_9HELO|nr:hypothetical protein BJ878DRAFT_480144 [Calycina marina]
MFPEPDVPSSFLTSTHPRSTSDQLICDPRPITHTQVHRHLAQRCIQQLLDPSTTTTSHHPNTTETTANMPTDNRSSPTSRPGHGSRSPGSILLSTKNLDSALERAGAKPKAPQRISTWRDEVTAELQKAPLPPSGPEPSVVPSKRVSKFFHRLAKPFSSRTNSLFDESGEEGEERRDYFNTHMYDGVPEGGMYAGGRYYAGSMNSSMNFGSEDSRFAPPPALGSFGFDRVEQREARLDRANDLYKKLNQQTMKESGHVN